MRGQVRFWKHLLATVGCASLSVMVLRQGFVNTFSPPLRQGYVMKYATKRVIPLSDAVEITLEYFQFILKIEL